MVNITQELIQKCLEARKKAVLIPTSKTKVGALLYDIDGNIWEGWNIQNRCHKSYHAEEMAILNALLQKANMNHMQGMIVSFSSTIKKLTFCCGICRQLIWEYIQNPNFLVTEVDLEGHILESKTINELYPNPYPRM